MFRFIRNLEDINRKELKRATQREPPKPSFLVRCICYSASYAICVLLLYLYITLFTLCSRI